MKKKNKKGGDEEPDIENQLGDIEEGKVKATKDSVNVDNTPSKKEVEASDDEYDELDSASNAMEEGRAGPGYNVGGTRKRRGNGHKANCNCPICKNMRKKTRRHRKRSHRRR